MLVIVGIGQENVDRVEDIVQCKFGNHENRCGAFLVDEGWPNIGVDILGYID